MNLREAEHEDPVISHIIQVKTRGVPKYKLSGWRNDPNFRPFWYHDRLFVRDGLLYGSLNAKNSHSDPVVVVPQACKLIYYS